MKEARTWSGGKLSKTEANDLNRSEPADTNGLTNGDAPVDVSWLLMKHCDTNEVTNGDAPIDVS